MKADIACGGTGGHILPGISVGSSLLKKGHDVRLWLGERDVEGASASKWDGEIETVKGLGFPSGLSFGSIVAVFAAISAFFSARRRMKASLPDVVLGMGGYACVGPVLAAASLRIPIVLHESNMVPGRAIEFLSRYAFKIATGFRETGSCFKAVPTVHTGFPVRADIHSSFKKGMLEEGVFTVLVMGGSQGASKLNEIASKACLDMHKKHVDFQVVHLSGRAEESSIREFYASNGINAKVYGFLEDMGAAYDAADIAIARSGAATCAELCVCSLPALLVPLPWARKDHQMANASYLNSKGAVDVVEQKDLTVEYLADYLSSCMSDKEKLAGMSRALLSCAVADADDKIAQLVEEAAVVERK